MITMDWANIGYDVITLVITFIITTILAYIALWIIDKGLSEIDFTLIQNDPKAEAIGSLGWMMIYSLVFAGGHLSHHSLLIP